MNNAPDKPWGRKRTKKSRKRLRRKLKRLKDKARIAALKE